MSAPRVACWLSLVFSSFALSGCASTSGSEWLNSPIDAPAQATSEASTLPSELAPEARPRLSHTVTLGESYADARGTYAAPVGDAVPVQVNVHTQVPVIVNNYGGYGYGYGYSAGYGGYSYGSGYGVSVRASGSSARSTHTTEAKVGADFPAVPDYGPRAMK